MLKSAVDVPWQPPSPRNCFGDSTVPVPPLPTRLFPRLVVGLLTLGVIAAGIVVWQRVSRQRDWAALRPPAASSTANLPPRVESRLAAAAARFQQAPPDEAALVEFARVCHANGLLDSAAAGYRALSTVQPSEARWPYLLALIVAGYGRLDEAIPLFRQSLQLAPDYLTGWLKLGDALLKSNQLVEAEAAYRQALRRDPANRFALLGLARCDLQSDRLTSARSNLQRAVANHPDFASAQSLLGTVFERLGNAEAAALARSRVQQGGHYGEHPDPWAEELTLESHDPYTLLIAASAAVADENIPRARLLLERGLALAPEDARLHRQLGKALAISGDYAGARRELERAVALAPTNEAIRFDLLAILRRIGDGDAFARVVNDGLVVSPTSAGLHFEAGTLAAQSGRKDDAISHFEASWRQGPDQPAAGLELADLYFSAARVPHAVALLEDMVTRFPKDHRPLLRLVRHGVEHDDPRTDIWLEQAKRAEVPPALLAELRDAYRRRLGATTP